MNDFVGKFYLITYQRYFHLTKEWEFFNEVHNGSIADWLFKAKASMEYWCFLNAIEITEQEFYKIEKIEDIVE